MSCSDERSSEEPTTPARIPPGGFRELGPINWAIAKLGARRIRAPKFHLFNVLGQHKLLFLAMLPFWGYLLYAGKLSRKDADVAQSHSVEEARQRHSAKLHPRPAG